MKCAVAFDLDQSDAGCGQIGDGDKVIADRDQFNKVLVGRVKRGASKRSTGRCANRISPTRWPARVG